MKKLLIPLLLCSFIGTAINHQKTTNTSPFIETINQKTSVLKRNLNQRNTLHYGDEYENGASIFSRDSSSYYSFDELGNFTDIKNEINENSNSNLNNDIEHLNIEKDNAIMVAADINSDNNENNNSFEKASTVYAASSRDIGCYGLYIGWWANIHEIADEDYYSYDVFMKGQLTVDLSSIPSGCDYDVYLYRMANSLTSSCNDSELLSSSRNGGNSSEQIIYDVIPGTYYIKVKSYSGYSAESYHIEFTLIDSRTYDEGHYSISNRRLNGDKAALWVSDYTPCSVELKFNEVKNSNVEFKNYSTYPMIKHLADKYTETEDIEYRCLYLWDVELRRYLRDYCNTMWQILNDYYKNGDPYLEDLTASLNNNSIGLSVAGTIIGLLPIPGAQVVGFALATAALGCTFGAMDIDNKNIAFRGKVSEIKDYLLALKHEMDIGNNVTYSNEVIMMRSCYRFVSKKEGILFWQTTKHYIDCSQRYRASSSYIYESDVIDFYHEGSPINGSIIGISSINDLKNI